MPPDLIGNPTVLIAVAEGCDYCVVPAATVALAMQADGGQCESVSPLKVVLVGTRQADLAANQWLIDGLMSDGISASTMLKTEPIRNAMGTELVPTVLVVDERSVAVAEWIGLDPGHGPDLVAAVKEAIGCASQPRAEPIVPSALAVVVPGQQVPSWILDELGISERLPATLVFSDGGRRGNMLLKGVRVSDYGER